MNPPSAVAETAFQSFASMLQQRFSELFRHTLKNSLQPVPLDETPPQLQLPRYAAQIELKGPGIEGYLAVESDERFLLATHPERSFSISLGPDDFQDWLIELIDRTLAACKEFFASNGWYLEITRPLSLFSLEHTPYHDEVVYALASGDLLVLLSVGLNTLPQAERPSA